MSEETNTIYSDGPQMLEDRTKYRSAGKTLRWWRLLDEICQDELAERAEIKRDLDTTSPAITRQRIIKYESGKLIPYKDHLDAIDWVLRANGAVLEAFGYEVETEPVDPVAKLETIAAALSYSKRSERECR